MVDFNIERDIDRVDEVYKELSLSATHTNSQLEMLANYILYGRDENGQNAVDRKEVQIETKYKSYKKKKSESLDELMESPVFNENEVSPIHRTVYKNPKPVLDKTIPEMQPLLESIQYFEELKESLEAAPQTKETQTRIWQLSHTIIQLKKDQYALQDAVRHTIKCMNLLPQRGTEIEDLALNVKPLGLKIGDLKRFTNPKEDTKSRVAFSFKEDEATLDLENPTHIYAILELWQSLYEKSLGNPYQNAKYLLETLDFYIGRTPLAPSRLDIIKLKKFKFSNTQIRNYLRAHYDLDYNENYISTIYTKEICKKISEAVTLHKEEWEARGDEDRWKKCSCCGQWKIKDPRNFVRKKSSPDGFTARCKMCDKKIKEEKAKGVK